VNVDFLQALQARLDGIDLFESEFAHASEHSIELQVLYLQHVLANRDGWNIVPILVDSFEADVEARAPPLSAREVEAFLGALGETIREAGGPDRFA
jgi:AmmeMemoRadiSam system protein B